MVRRRKSPKIDGRSIENEADYRNIEAYGDYFERLKKIAISMFEWVNLPESMDGRYLELCLFEFGQAALLYDEQYGFINTKAASLGQLNVYGLPTGLDCYSFDYSAPRKVYQGGDINKNYDGDNNSEECVLVMNNADRIPTAATLHLFAERLADTERACEANIRLQKFPLIFNVDEKQKLAANRMFEDYDSNKPVIFADKNQMMGESIKVLNTEVPFVADKLMDYKKQIWNEYLTFLGVSNLDEKKERLIESESNANNEVTNLNLQSYLAPRQKAAEQFNKLFNLAGDKAVSVRVRSDLYNIIKEEESIVQDFVDKDNDGILDLGEDAENE